MKCWNKTKVEFVTVYSADQLVFRLTVKRENFC